jgi:hypothetical protein
MARRQSHFQNCIVRHQTPRKRAVSYQQSTLSSTSKHSTPLRHSAPSSVTRPLWASFNDDEDPAGDCWDRRERGKGNGEGGNEGGSGVGNLPDIRNPVPMSAGGIAKGTRRRSKGAEEELSKEAMDRMLGKRESERIMKRRELRLEAELQEKEAKRAEVSEPCFLLLY